MALTDVLHEAKKLSRSENVRLIQMVAECLATDEFDFMKPGQPCPVWSPFNDHAAAAKMTRDELLQYVAGVVDRRDISPTDRAIVANLLITKFRMRNKEVAEAFCVKPPQITQYLYLLRCVPEIQIMVHRGLITMEEAKLRRFNSKTEQIRFAEERACQHGVSVPELVGAPRRRGQSKKR